MLKCCVTECDEARHNNPLFLTLTATQCLLQLRSVKHTRKTRNKTFWLFSNPHRREGPGLAPSLDMISGTLRSQKVIRW